MTAVDIAVVQPVTRASSFIVGKVEIAHFRPSKKKKRNNALLKPAIKLLAREEERRMGETDLRQCRSVVKIEGEEGSVHRTTA